MISPKRTADRKSLLQAAARKRPRISGGVSVDGPHNQSRDGTQSLKRALSILRLLASGPASGMKLVQISAGAGLHHSTAHRILRALEAEGIVERTASPRSYKIGAELVWLGLGASSRFPIAIAAASALDNLSEQIGDAIFLTVRSGNDSVCADRRIGGYPIQVLSIAIGSRRPLGVSHAGRAILAFLPNPVTQQITAANANRFAQYTINPTDIIESIKSARVAGYICSDGVSVKDTRVVAVPILDVTGIPVAAISVIAVRHRLPANRIPSIVAALKSAAQDVSQLLSVAASNRPRRRPANP